MLRRFRLALRSRLRDLAIPKELGVIYHVDCIKSDFGMLCILISFVAAVLVLGLASLFATNNKNFDEAESFAYALWFSIITFVVVSISSYYILNQTRIGRYYRRHPRKEEVLELARNIARLNDRINQLRELGVDQSSKFQDAISERNRCIDMFNSIWDDNAPLPDRLVRDTDTDKIIEKSKAIRQSIQEETDWIARAASTDNVNDSELDIASESCIKIVP